MTDHTDIMDVVVPVTRDNLGILDRTLHLVTDQSGEVSRIIIAAEDIRETRSCLNRSGWNPDASNLSLCPKNTDELKSLTGNNSDYISLIRPGVEAGDKWLFRLLNHLRRNRSLDAVFPMALNGAPVQDPLFRLGLETEIAGDVQSIDRYVMYALEARTAQVPTRPHPDVWAAVAERDIADQLMQNVFTKAVPTSIDLKNSVLALDVCLRMPDKGVPDPSRFSGRLSNKQSEAARERAGELAEWIGRTIPKSHRREKHYQLANGHLRLAFHFGKRGNHDQVMKHLRNALKDSPGDPMIGEVAAEFGIGMEDLTS